MNSPSLVGAGAGAGACARTYGEKIRNIRAKKAKNLRKDTDETQPAILFMLAKGGEREREIIMRRIAETENLNRRDEWVRRDESARERRPAGHYGQAQLALPTFWSLITIHFTYSTIVWVRCVGSI